MTREVTPRPKTGAWEEAGGFPTGARDEVEPGPGDEHRQLPIIGTVHKAAYAVSSASPTCQGVHRIACYLSNTLSRMEPAVGTVIRAEVVDAFQHGAHRLPSTVAQQAEHISTERSGAWMQTRVSFF